ncbi:hypothetical protein MMC21_008408 [Puttea exsequens]|nr:hypothetical protein [Puttea exsequens]
MYEKIDGRELKELPSLRESLRFPARVHNQTVTQLPRRCKYYRGRSSLFQNSLGQHEAGPSSYSTSDENDARDEVPRLANPFGRNDIAEWKAGSGRKKDWRTKPQPNLSATVRQITPAIRSYRSSMPCHPPGSDDLVAINDIVYAVARSAVFPVESLRTLTPTPSASVSIPMFRAATWALKELKRKGKTEIQRPPVSNPRSRANLREEIDDGIFLACSQNGLMSGDFKPPYVQRVHAAEFPPKAADIRLFASSCSANRSRTAPTWKLLTRPDTIALPYESHIGAIIGDRFALRGLVQVEASYEIHAAEDILLDNASPLIVKVFTIRGTRGKAREYRVKSLKRNAAKSSCVSSIEQSGKKWLFFRDVADEKRPSDTTGKAWPWQSRRHYEQSFPSLVHEPANIEGSPMPLFKSYALCARQSPAKFIPGGTPELQSADKKTRTRDRQRRKRQQKRAAKSAASDEVDRTISTVDKLSQSKLDNMSLTFNDFHRQHGELLKKPRDCLKGGEKSGEQNLAVETKTATLPVFEEIDRNDSGRSPPQAPEEKMEEKWQEVRPQRRYRTKYPSNHLEYFQNLDESTGYNRYQDVDEQLWQELISGPVIGMKKRFFEILERSKEDMRAEADTAFKNIREHAVAEKKRDLLILSQFLRSANMHCRDNNPSEYRAFANIVHEFYMDDNRGLHAMELLLEGSEVKLAPLVDFHRPPVTYKRIREIMMLENKKRGLPRLENPGPGPISRRDFHN